MRDNSVLTDLDMPQLMTIVSDFRVRASRNDMPFASGLWRASKRAPLLGGVH